MIIGVQVDELAAVVVVVGADGERQALLDHGLGLKRGEFLEAI